jgi:hypothetical protein
MHQHAQSDSEIYFPEMNCIIAEKAMAADHIRMRSADRTRARDEVFEMPPVYELNQIEFPVMENTFYEEEEKKSQLETEKKEDEPTYQS